MARAAVVVSGCAGGHRREPLEADLESQAEALVLEQRAAHAEHVAAPADLYVVLVLEAALASLHAVDPARSARGGLEGFLAQRQVAGGLKQMAPIAAMLETSAVRYVE